MRKIINITDRYITWISSSLLISLTNFWAFPFPSATGFASVIILPFSHLDIHCNQKQNPEIFTYLKINYSYGNFSLHNDLSSKSQTTSQLKFINIYLFFQTKKFQVPSFVFNCYLRICTCFSIPSNPPTIAESYRWMRYSRQRHDTNQKTALWNVKSFEFQQWVFLSC